MMALDSTKEEELYSLESGGQYFLTGRDPPDRIAHNNFVVREGRSPGFSVWFFGCKAICFLVCPVMYAYVRYPMYRRSSSSSCSTLEKWLLWRFLFLSDMVISSREDEASGALKIDATTLTSSLRGTT